MTPLTPRAVIEGRTRARPSTGLIVGLVLAGAGVLLVMIIYLVLDGARHTLLATLMSLPVGAIVVAGLLMLDRFEPEPPLKLLFAFLWGAGVAGLLALVINTLGILAIMASIGRAPGELLGSALFGPVVEESLKGAVLLLLLWRRRDEINGVTDCVMYAGMVGMGFTVLEDINYYASALDESGTMAAVVWAFRSLASPLCHPLFTSATAIGVGYAASRRRGRNGVLAVVGGWLIAVTLHMTWNFSAGFGLLGLVISWLLLAGETVVLIILLVQDRHRTVGLIQHYLPMYDRFGIVTPADVGMLSRLGSRRDARRWAKTRLGPQAARAMADYQLAATELALLHAHAESRTVSPERFAFRQQSLVTLMQAARAAFHPPAPATGWSQHPHR